MPCSVPFNSCNFPRNELHTFVLFSSTSWSGTCLLESRTIAHPSKALGRFVCTCILFCFQVVTLVLFRFFIGNMGKKILCREPDNQRQQQFIIFLMCSKLWFSNCTRKITNIQLNIQLWSFFLWHKLLKIFIWSHALEKRDGTSPFSWLCLASSVLMELKLISACIPEELCSEISWLSWTLIYLRFTFCPHL